MLQIKMENLARLGGIFRTKSTWIQLLLALGLGLIASVLAFKFLDREEAQFKAKFLESQKQHTRAVVVGTQHLTPGAIVGDSNMAVRDVPVDYIYFDTVTPDKFDKVTGETLVKPLAKGQPLLYSLLSEGGPMDFSDSLKPGRRALSLHVDELASFSGLLRPGDYVDIMVEDQGNAQILLQGILVIATGTQTKADNLTPSDGPMHYTTITLDVSLEEAMMITQAKAAGDIDLLLLNRKDVDKTFQSGKSGVKMQSASDAPAGNVVEQKLKHFEYLYGGSKDGVVHTKEVAIEPPTQYAKPGAGKSSPRKQ